MGFEKRLLGLVRKGQVKLAPAITGPHLKHLHRLPSSGKIDRGFVPIYFRFLARVMSARNVALALEPEFAFALTDIPTHVGLPADKAVLLHQPLINPMRGVPLFTRRL